MQADDGYIYPLERAFFYIHKPPMLLQHEDIESVEFARQDGAMAASTKTFDLVIRYRAGAVRSPPPFLLEYYRHPVCTSIAD